MNLCVQCNKHFNNGLEVCPSDGSSLVPVGKPLIGDLINQRYRVLNAIGKGSMGVVYRAKEEESDKEVAVKVLHTLLGTQSDQVKRFKREAQTISNVQHPNIVTFFEFGFIDDQQPYIVTELLKGITLTQLIRESGQLSLERALPIIGQVCEAVTEAHRQGVVHRDLKPDNIILLKTAGNNFQVKVVDFGVAKFSSQFVPEGAVTGSISGGNLTMEGRVCGSPAYMSPEQCRALPVDYRADIYSLGVMVFEMLTGRRPFVAEEVLALMVMHVNDKPPSMSAVRLDLEFPSQLDDTIRKALSKNPEDRQSTVAEFWSEVKSAIENGQSGSKNAKVRRGSDGQNKWIEFKEKERAQSVQNFSPRADLSQKKASTTQRPTFQTARYRQQVSIPGWLVFVALFAIGCAIAWCVYNQAGAKTALILGQEGRYELAWHVLCSTNPDRLLDRSNREEVDMAYIKVAMKCAQNNEYQLALDLLTRVPSDSEHFAVAAKLIKRYQEHI